MGFLGNILKGAVNVAILPVDVAVDLVTMGVRVTDGERLYTADRLSKIVKSIEDAGDSASESDYL